MEALIARLRKMMGKYTVAIIALGATATLVALTIRTDGFLHSILVRLITMLAVILIIVMVAATRALTKYRLAKATQPYEKIVDPLVRSNREYCLVLRAFGEDGKITLPREYKKGRVGFALGLTPNLTMEQVVAAAVEDSLSLPTYAIVDQSVAIAPPGLTFIRVPNDRWKAVVAELIGGAHTVVLLLGRERELGKGFAWEIEQLVRHDVASRVVLTLPPRDQDEFSHQRALHQASVLLALLTSTGRLDELEQFRAYEYEVQLPSTTQVVCTTRTSAVRFWQVDLTTPERKVGLWRRMRQYRGPTVVTNLTYKAALTEALLGTNKQLEGLSLPARYPARFR
jgi:hypothetical protein